MMSDSMSVLPENKLLSKFTSGPKTVVTQSEIDKVLLAYYFDLPDIIVRLIFYRDQLKFVKMEDFDQTALSYDLLFQTFPNIGNIRNMDYKAYSHFLHFYKYMLL